MSKVTIGNSALIKLGVKTVIDFEQDTKAAKLLKLQYPILLDEVLADHPWNFAIKRIILSKNATAPIFGFDNAFDLPSDLLRILYPLSFEDGLPTNTVWQREGNQIITSEDEFKIRYIFRQEDTTQYSPHFKESLALRIAADLAFSLKESRILQEHFFALYQRHAAVARTMDAREGTPEVISANLFLNSRIVGTTYGAN